MRVNVTNNQHVELAVARRRREDRIRQVCERQVASDGLGLGCLGLSGIYDSMLGCDCQVEYAAAARVWWNIFGLNANHAYWTAQAAGITVDDIVRA